MANETQFDIRYATAAITQAKEITFDLILVSFSKTAIEVIHDITRVKIAITVILLIITAHPLRRKHSKAIIKTVIRYLSHPPLLKRIGMSNAAQTIPNKTHFSININKLSIKHSF